MIKAMKKALTFMVTAGLCISLMTVTSFAAFEKTLECEDTVIGSNTGTRDADGILCNVDTDAAGHCTWGPGDASLVPAGQMYAIFYIKLLDKQNDGSVEVANLDIFADPDTAPVAELKIHEEDFTALDKYQAFVIPFTAEANRPYQFRTWFYANDSFKIDKIVVSDVNPADVKKDDTAGTEKPPVDTPAAEKPDAGTTTTSNPSTGDVGMIGFVGAALISASGMLALKKRSK